jgi:hypothetical protein
MAYVTAGNRRGGRVLVYQNFRYIRNHVGKTGISVVKLFPHCCSSIDVGYFSCLLLTQLL